VEGEAVMADYWGTICRFLALLVLIGRRWMSASAPEASFETAYSTIGTQIKWAVERLLPQSVH
jgi:hypothetical protein